MKPSTAVTVVSLAVCATLVDARMATEVKRDNATVVEEPKLVKRENCWTYYADNVYDATKGRRFYSERVGYVHLGELTMPPWNPEKEIWVPTLERCSKKENVRKLDEIEPGYTHGLDDALCCDDCNSHGCEKPVSGKYPANSDKSECVVM